MFGRITHHRLQMQPFPRLIPPSNTPRIKTTAMSGSEWTDLRSKKYTCHLWKWLEWFTGAVFGDKTTGERGVQTVPWTSQQCGFDSHFLTGIWNSRLGSFMHKFSLFQHPYSASEHTLHTRPPTRCRTLSGLHFSISILKLAVLPTYLFLFLSPHVYVVCPQNDATANTCIRKTVISCVHVCWLIVLLVLYWLFGWLVGRWFGCLFTDWLVRGHLLVVWEAGIYWTDVHSMTRS